MVLVVLTLVEVEVELEPPVAMVAMVDMVLCML